MKTITMRTINECSEQEILKFVAYNLVKQNATSTRKRSDGLPRCAYRGDNGLKCAVGFCIEDDEYDQAMEGQSVDGAAFGQFEISYDRRRLLSELQGIHDSHPEDCWQACIHSLAVSICYNEEAVAAVDEAMNRAVAERA